jgi:rhamnogalacturonyl hydrolase YesR
MMKRSEIISIVRESIDKVQEWVENHGYKGYEPADALSSFVRPLTFGNLFLERLLIQVFKQSPVNLRPILGVRPHETTIGRGYMASGNLVMFKLTGEGRFKEKAISCLDWLMKNKSPKFKEYSWGNHYDFAGRSGKYSQFEPIIVWTSVIGQTFLDAYELLKDGRYLRVGESICEWILNLPREQTKKGICLSYVATYQSSIHNSNMLGAAMLARTGKLTGKDECLKVAKEAMQYSCSRQRDDGAWYYGEAPNQHWIDNFHTGYNLDSLWCYIESTEDRSYEDNLARGVEFFKDNFFEESGKPKYYHNRTYPVDIQCASQAIETLANCGYRDDSSIDLASKVAKWTIENMQDKRGFFYFRQYPYLYSKTPMMHWGQTTMYKGLSSLLLKLSSREKTCVDSYCF